MGRATGPACAETPGIIPEEKGEKTEEKAGDFEPEHTGGMGKGLPDGKAEAAGALAKAAAAIFVDGGLFFDVGRGAGGILLGLALKESREETSADAHSATDPVCLHKPSLEHSPFVFEGAAIGRPGRVRKGGFRQLPLCKRMKQRCFGCKQRSGLPMAEHGR